MRRSTCVVASVFLVSLLGSGLATGQVNDQNEVKNARSSASDVFLFGTQTPIVPASSTLTRTVRGGSMTVSTSGLIPDNVYTNWWLVFNHPEHCGATPCGLSDFANSKVQGSVLWATGRVADGQGQATFDAHLAPSAPEGVVLFGPGLINPLTAEVHIAVRWHGAIGANGDSLQDQLTMINGGCAVACTNVQVAIHLP